MTFAILCLLSPAFGFSSADIGSAGVHDQVTAEAARLAPDAPGGPARSKWLYRVRLDAGTLHARPDQMDQMVQLVDGSQMGLLLDRPTQGYVPLCRLGDGAGIVTTNRYSPADHFDRSQPGQDSVELLRRDLDLLHSRFVRLGDPATPPDERARLFGLVVHALEDLHSHSNFAELTANLAPTTYLPAEAELLSASGGSARRRRGLDRLEPWPAEGPAPVTAGNVIETGSWYRSEDAARVQAAAVSLDHCVDRAIGGASPCTEADYAAMRGYFLLTWFPGDPRPRSVDAPPSEGAGVMERERRSDDPAPLAGEPEWCGASDQVGCYQPRPRLAHEGALIDRGCTTRWVHYGPVVLPPAEYSHACFAKDSEKDGKIRVYREDSIQVDRRNFLFERAFEGAAVRTAYALARARAAAGDEAWGKMLDWTREWWRSTP